MRGTSLSNTYHAPQGGAVRLRVSGFAPLRRDKFYEQ